MMVLVFNFVTVRTDNCFALLALEAHVLLFALGAKSEFGEAFCV